MFEKIILKNAKNLQKTIMLGAAQENWDILYK